MNQITIEKGIPMPPRVRKAGLMTMLKQMEVGDSFILPEGRKVATLRANASANKIGIYAREDAEGQIRVWKTR